MREIKFRALELDTGRIVYGYYVVESGYWMSNGAPDLSKPVTRHYIVNDGVKHDVLESAVQQFIGLKDINGADIYEGDIVKPTNPIWGAGGVGRIEFFGGSFVNRKINADYMFHGMNSIHHEIIGNIYENPELIK